MCEDIEGGSRNLSLAMRGTLRKNSIQREDQLKFTVFSRKSSATPQAINNERSLRILTEERIGL